LHIPEKVAKEAMDRLAAAFPRRLARQREIIAEITSTGSLKTFLGRRRQFFERLYDSSTHREGLAQTQQSTISWLLGMGLWRVWSELDSSVNIDKAPKPSDPNRVWLLAQVHDAILGMVRVGDLATLHEVRRLMDIPLVIRGRTCHIPTEVLYGTSWRHSDMKKLGKEAHES
jgi:DNA polymerase I-like protein with 3'-5' exonuclease and polymerase domains